MPRAKGNSQSGSLHLVGTGIKQSHGEEVETVTSVGIPPECLPFLPIFLPSFHKHPCLSVLDSSAHSGRSRPYRQSLPSLREGRKQPHKQKWIGWCNSDQGLLWLRGPWKALQRWAGTTEMPAYFHTPSHFISPVTLWSSVVVITMVTTEVQRS